MRNRSSLLRALSYTKKHIPVLVLTILLYGASVFCTLRIPVFIGRAIDLLTDSGSIDFAGIVSCPDDQQQDARRRPSPFYVFNFQFSIYRSYIRS